VPCTRPAEQAIRRVAIDAEIRIFVS